MFHLVGSIRSPPVQATRGPCPRPPVAKELLLLSSSPKLWLHFLCFSSCNMFSIPGVYGSKQNGSRSVDLPAPESGNLLTNFMYCEPGSYSLLLSHRVWNWTGQGAVRVCCCWK